MASPLLKMIVLLFLCMSSLAEAQTAESLRQHAIKEDLSKLEAELHASGASSWEEWFDRLEPFRTELNGLLGLAEKNQSHPEGGSPLSLLHVHAPGLPPMYDRASSAGYLLALYQPAAQFLERPSITTIVSVSKWLKSQGIDLLFVPVPGKIEVYADRVVKSCPPGGITSPLVRKLLHTMLEQDVEVIDLLPAFLNAAKDNSELLYLPTDHHWSERAQRITADAILARLKRYPFVATALKQPRIFHTDRVPMKWLPGNGYMTDYLTPDERQIVRSYPYPKQSVTRTLDRSNNPYNEPNDGPVLVIGDSYTHFFKIAIEGGSGIDAILAERLNTNVSNISMASATTQPIKELLRNQDRLRVHRVVVWILVMEDMLLPSGWDLPPLPSAVPLAR